MERRVCPKCNQVLYSAATASVWICPECGAEVDVVRSLLGHEPVDARTPGMEGRLIRHVRTKTEAG